MKRSTSSRFLVVLLWAVVLGARPASGVDQQTCDVLLGEARAHYEIGRFDAAVEAIEKCLETARQRPEKTQAYSLLAKVYVAMDEVARADAAIAELLRVSPDYEPGLLDSPRYVAAVNAAKRESTEVRVSSVSKTSESLREAPATVVVVTSEEIERRGYLDLEAVIHDLPGFDISRSEGQFYSNIYQRGYRSDLTERTLVLVDGVEENDLWTSAVYLSRQYPLSNVERVEVIYGPASTMYGANAFAGVINVVTKDPGEALAERPGAFLGKRPRLSVRMDGTRGSFGTLNADLLVAGRTSNGSLSWSLAGRVYRSDGNDLSEFEDWDFKTDIFDGIDYFAKLSIEGAQGREDFLKFLAENGLPNCTANEGCVYQVTEDGVLLTPQGEARARELDRRALTEQQFKGRTAGFTNETRDWLLHGKVKLSNLVVGFQTWRRQEGWVTWRTDADSFGNRRWIPEQSWLYLNYSRSLSPVLSLTLFSQYKQHQLDGGSNQIFPRYYASSSRRTLEDLAQDLEPQWVEQFFFLDNSQFRNELKVIYDPSERFSLVSGVELKNSSLQGLFVRSDEPRPAETGAPTGPSFGGDNRLAVRDFGFYTQASIHPTEKLKLVAGGRLDHNEVRDSFGYGTVFNPRLAAVYTLKDFVFKAIYAEAFQDVSVSNKYNSTNSGSVLPNPGLDPERVKNLEVSGSWRFSDVFAVEVAGYQADYSGIAELDRVPCDQIRFPGCTGTSFQFQNGGALEIRGVQIDATLKYKGFEIFGNYTFTDPRNTTLDKRIGDIASHQLNFGLHRRFANKLKVDLRANYVGTRETGKNTTVTTNPYDEIAPYVIANATLSYEDLLPGATLQLIVINLCDELYYDPGIRSAGVGFPARHPQPGRAAFLRFSVHF